MSLQDEEMKRRRDKREAQRRRQQAQQRKLRRRLILAVLVLAAGGLAIGFLIRNAGIWGVSQSSPQATQAQTEAPTQPEEEESPLLQQPTTTVHIKAAGDLNITDSVIDSGLAASGYDFSRVFQDVSAVLSDADLTVLNLEGNFCGEPYGTQTTSAPERILQDLRGCGVDMIQVANSTIINNGLSGLSSTINAIRKAGMEPLGAYANEREYKEGKGYTMTEVQGIKIAFVAFTKGLGGRGMPTGSEELVNLLYLDYAETYQKEDEERIKTILKNVEAEKPDITIAMLHWGSEYNDDISKSQKKIISLMQKGGVDVILGTHPHLLQSIDYDPVKGTLTAYSLGDFFGDAQRGGTNYSIILDLEITKDNTTNITKVSGYSYTPIYTVKYGECNGYREGERRVVRISSALRAFGPDISAEQARTNGLFLDSVTKSTKDSMEYALSRIEYRKLTQEQKDAMKEAEKAAQEAASAKEKKK